jgi:segregation and condensation protein B
METLAVVAYRQPVLRAEIEAIRGVQSGEVLRQLIERDLVRIAGRSDELGRPFLYGTTKQFLQVFGLRQLDELPNQTHQSLVAEEETNVKTLTTPKPRKKPLDENQIGALTQPRHDDRPGHQSAYDKHDEDEEDIDEDLEDEDDDDDEEEDDDDLDDEPWEEVEDDEDLDEEEDDEEDEDWEDEDWDDDDDEDWDDDDDDDEEEEEEEAGE